MNTDSALCKIDRINFVPVKVIAKKSKEFLMVCFCFNIALAGKERERESFCFVFGSVSKGVVSGKEFFEKTVV